jgi:hypothetical protein
MSTSPNPAAPGDDAITSACPAGGHHLSGPEPNVRRRRVMDWKTSYRVCFAIFFAGWLNFMVFGIAAVSLGGDAMSGKVEGGHYYLSNHGHLTEVSSGVFTYSRIHTYSIFITQPLALLAGFIGHRIKKSHEQSAA